MLPLSRPAVDANNNPLGYSYTAAQVDAALHASSRTMLFRFNLLDSTNAFKKQLTTVVDGSTSINFDYTQTIQRTMQLTMQDDPDINWLSDRIQPFALLYMPTAKAGLPTEEYTFVAPAQPAEYETIYATRAPGAYAQFPLGVFILSTPPQVTDASLVVTRQVNGYDLNQVLSDWKTQDRYTIASGTNYITAVQTLLSDAGITQTNLQGTSLQLQTDLDYDGGTPYLTIINDLLKQINYINLWFDENGIAIAQPWANPATTAPAYTYTDDSQSVTLPTLTRNYDLFSVPNVWVVVVAQTTSASISSTYTNSNADSPTSTVNRGRKIVSYTTDLNAPLSETLDSFAQKLAFDDSQIYETITHETALMPMHGCYDVIRLNFSALDIAYNYSELGWSMTLSAGATMTHTLQRVVPV